MSEIKPKKLNTNSVCCSGDSAILPKRVNRSVDTVNILDRCDPIPDVNKLKEKLNELGIRFNTDPKVYQKRDYWLLMCILYRALTYLYTQEVPSIGENFARIARLNGSNLELTNPVAVNEDDVEDPEHTIPSVAYLSNYVLRWEAF